MSKNRYTAKRDITLEMIEERYEIYPGTDDKPMGGIWSKPRDTVFSSGVIRKDGNKWLSFSKDKDGYFKVLIYPGEGRCEFKVHQLIAMKYLGLNYNQVVDHINHDIHDNRLENLRIVDAQHNSFNMKNISTYGGKKCLSKYKGVGWAMSNKKWRVRILAEGKRIHVGLFNDEKSAALAYDDAALRYFGEHAWLNQDNFPELNKKR